MQGLELVVRNGTVVTAVDSFACDVGVRGGRVVALGEDLPRGAEEIDAAASSCSRAGSTAIAISSSSRAWGSGTPTISRAARVSAAFGGTTTVIPFAAQHRGDSMREVVADYRERARKAVVDHAFHMIVSDPSEPVLAASCRG